MAEAAHYEPGVAHHFDNAEQQFDSGKLGMWLFLATEVLLFGGLFVAYAVYRANHPEIFVYAHQFLDKTWGGINTLVLICSSLTMAWGVRAAQLSGEGDEMRLEPRGDLQGGGINLDEARLVEDPARRGDDPAARLQVR